ncbi:MAG TPA: hypothetical protein VHK88_06060, partial [Aquihabitans sp.]|nr:hypothetical protein [Aquihabitans sp.]
TPFQLEDSAKAPCTSTMVGASDVVGFRGMARVLRGAAWGVVGDEPVAEVDDRAGSTGCASLATTRTGDVLVRRPVECSTGGR